MNNNLKLYIKNLIDGNVLSYFTDTWDKPNILSDSEKELCTIMSNGDILGATFLYFDSATNKPYILFPGYENPVVKDDHTVIRIPYSYFFSTKDFPNMMVNFCQPETEQVVQRAINASYPSVDLRSDYATPLFMKGEVQYKKPLFRCDSFFYENLGDVHRRKQYDHPALMHNEPMVLVHCEEIIFVLVHYIRAMARWLRIHPNSLPSRIERRLFPWGNSYKDYFSNETADKLEEFILTHQHGGKVFAYKELKDSPHASLWNDSPAAKMLTSDDPSLLTEENFELLHQNLYFPLLPYLVLYCDQVLKNNEPLLLPAHMLIPVCDVSGYEVLCQGENGFEPRANIMYALVTINEMIPYESEKEHGKKINQLVSDIRDIGETIFIHSLRKRSNSEILEQRRGEISRIFLRNFQHNIGSHVLSHFNTPSCLNGVDNEELSRLIAYITDRSAYCNEAVRGTPSLRESINLHDIIREFQQQQLLLKHISGRGENFRFYVLDNIYTKDLRVDLPGGTLGKQAFFNILENIIRNTAKHAVGDINYGSCDFVIRADDQCDPDLVKIEIYSTLKEADMQTDKSRRRFIERINSYIDEPLIDPVSGIGRQIHLGLAEMKCAAAFLQGHEVSEIDSWDPENRQHKPFLTAIAEGEHNLGYIFYMLKPQQLLVLSPHLNPNGKAQLNKKIKAICGNYFQMEITPIVDSGLSAGQMHFDDFYKNIFQFQETILHYKFIVCPDFVRAAIGKSLLPLFTLRILPFSSFDPNETITLPLLWKKWHQLNSEEKKSEWSSQWKLEYIGNGPGNEIATFFDHLDNSEDIRSAFNQCTYAEALSSAAQQWLPGFHKYGSINDWICEINNLEPEKYQLLESVNTTITIIDERIQEAAIKRSDYGISFFEHFKKAGIHVPDPEIINLQGTIATTEQKEEMLNKLNTFVNEHAYDTFILIHYGFLERLLTSGVKRRLWLNKLTNTVDARIVIMSGRGLPSGLPSDVTVVDWTSVRNAILDIRSKHLLSNLLYDARQVPPKNTTNL